MWTLETQHSKVIKASSEIPLNDNMLLFISEDTLAYFTMNQRANTLFLVENQIFISGRRLSGKVVETSIEEAITIVKECYKAFDFNYILVIKVGDIDITFNPLDYGDICEV
jgi:hypothetical protein